jgi:hypothetical protein
MALLIPAVAAADPPGCRGIELELMPATSDLQIVVWLEDAHGGFVRTAYITKLTGYLGLGNRPGRYDFKSGFQWPYGRRISTFPVWAHRHGRTYPQVVFGDDNEDSIGFHEAVSSPEPYFCRPQLPAQAGSVVLDAVSCPSRSFTSAKGKLRPSGSSQYPPRADLSSVTPRDSADAATFTQLNDLVAIAAATPPASQRLRVLLAEPTLPEGDYVVFVEVSREGDFNAAHRYPSFPSTMGLGDYGRDYLGQPSVVWSVPVSFRDGADEARVGDYVGYGAPRGEDGLLRPADSTITTDVSGSGGARLMVLQDERGPYRLRARSIFSAQVVAPPAPAQLQTGEVTAEQAQLSFLEPNGGATTTIAQYEVRYRVGDGVGDFSRALPGPKVAAGAPGQRMQLSLPDLRPQTPYTVAIRATDACGNVSAVSTTSFVTPQQTYRRLEGCVVATAAFGSPLSRYVHPMRRLRDRFAAAWPVADLLARWYRETAPPLARLLGASDGLRLGTRALLYPVAATARRVDSAMAPR